jgi:hypothetical protein
MATSRSTRLMAATVVAALTLTLLTPAQQAARPKDRLDQELPAKAIGLLKVLKKRDYKTVGVLKFRVKQGTQPANFDAGMLPSVLTTGVENALIVENGKDAPLDIIREAGKVVAGQKKHGSYLTESGRAALFEYDYPLAWGDRQVKADAFVTGVATIFPGKGTMRVAFEVIDGKTKKLEQVDSFEVRTDRSVLADLCQGFALNRGQIRRAGPGDDPDSDADKDAARRGERKEPPKRDDLLVELEILYDGEKQLVEPHSMKGGQYQVSQPRENQVVTFALKNVSDLKVGVVLAINGRNTLYNEPVHQYRPEECSRWILEPGKRSEIVGVYQEDDKKAVPFKVLPEEDSDREEELNPDPWLGAVELFTIVQREGGGREPPVERGGMVKTALGKARPRTAREAAELVKKAGGLQPRTAGLIVPDGGRTLDATLTAGALKNPQFWVDQVIWYRDRKPKGDQ